MTINRCTKCMRQYEPGEEVCPVCGNRHAEVETPPYALRPGTILKGAYLVGQVIGQGGFGITYIGLDLLLEKKVAIKEYFPLSTGTVSRATDNCTTVQWSTAVMKKNGQQHGFELFLKEARKMAKLDEIPGIVGVKSVFLENETAYIVMSFVEGETIKAKLEREGPMPFETCIELLEPIIRAMDEVHRHGIIHRDISPDNLMIRPDGKVLLLDLGAAKELETHTDHGMQSSQLVAKHGFSPVEQYMDKAEISARTDVYAMSATIYYMVTGKLPPRSLDRIYNDTLECPPQMIQAQFAALSKGLAIRSADRAASMGELLEILRAAGNAKAPEKAADPEPPKASDDSSKPAADSEPAKLVSTVTDKEVKTEPVKAPEKVSQEPAEVKKAPEPETKKGSSKTGLIIGAAIAAAAVIAAVLFLGGGKSEPAVSTEPAPTTVATEAPTETQPVETEPVETQPMPALLASSWSSQMPDRSAITSVQFRSLCTEMPSKAQEAAENVFFWLDGTELTVASKGVLTAPADSSRFFAGFTALTEIHWDGNLDTSSVTNMRRMFDGCSSLTELDLTGLDLSHVTDLSGLFRGCKSLTKVDMSGVTIAPNADLSDMFEGCVKLKTFLCDNDGIQEVYDKSPDTRKARNADANPDYVGPDYSGTPNWNQPTQPVPEVTVPVETTEPDDPFEPTEPDDPSGDLPDEEPTDPWDDPYPGGDDYAPTEDPDDYEDNDSDDSDFTGGGDDNSDDSGDYSDGGSDDTYDGGDYSDSGSDDFGGGESFDDIEPIWIG